MRRFLLLFVAANVLGLGPLSLGGSQAWAQNRGRVVRAKGKQPGNKKPPVKVGGKLDKTLDTDAGAADPLTGEPAATAATGAPPTRGPTRLDFDDRLIQGQTNKSGAVYLYDRKELKTRSMIRERESFRGETLATVYDQ
ncbi:hypothetical protein P2318_06300 [Myxococcaceae bacterium GXIMD 01537]